MIVTKLPEITSPIICPMVPRVTFKGTASVVALVFRKFAVSQLRRDGFAEYEKLVAMQSIAYRALNEVGGNAPAVDHITTIQNQSVNAPGSRMVLTLHEKR